MASAPASLVQSLHLCLDTHVSVPTHDAAGMGPTKHATFLCQTPPSLLDKIRQRQAHMRVDSGALWDRETSECC